MNNFLDITILSFVVIANIFFGFVVFKGSKQKKNVLFSLLILFVVLWSVFNYLAEISRSYIFVLWSVKLTYVFVTAVIAIFFHFSLIFLKNKPNKVIVVGNYLVAATIATISITPYFIEDVTIIDPRNNVTTGNLSLVFVFYLLISMAFSFSFLLIKHRRAKGAERAQIQYLFFGTLLTVVGAAIVNALIPALTDNWALSRYGPYFTIFLVGFTSYAIVKHRLMNVKFVVARSIAYAVLLAVLALFYAGSVLAIERIFFTDSFDQINLTQGAIRTVLAVIMAFSFQPLRRWITRKTDRIFFKNAYDPQKLLDDLSHLMSSTIVLDALLVKVLEILISDMKISRGIFILFKEDYSLYTVQTSGYKDEPKIDMKDAVSLARNGTAVYDELDEDSQYKEPLRKFEASISLPLKTEKEIVGVLLLGEKNSGDMFNQQDLRILEIIAPEVSVAIENAKSYEEISRFNVTLKNEVKHATKRLEEKNAQLRELDQAKDEFISMASHQLRTPLTVIKGYLSMLLEGDVGKITKSQQEFVHEAFDGSSRMVGLINDLLNVSRMDTGRFFIEPAEVDIEELVSQEVKELQKQAGDKGLYLKIAKTGKIPHVWVDETKIRQVVMNFIDNALYYTEEGGVTVKLEKIKDMVIYSVVDTGVGIPKAEQPKIFEKFFRAGNARKIRPDGTGLGIYLAKRVVEDHGGEIFFESTEGHGSTFGFKIPYRKHAMPEKDNHTPDPKILDVSTD